MTIWLPNYPFVERYHGVLLARHDRWTGAESFERANDVCEIDARCCVWIASLLGLKVSPKAFRGFSIFDLFFGPCRAIPARTVVDCLERTETKVATALWIAARERR